MMTVNWTSSVQKIVVMMIKKEGCICCLEVTHLKKTGSCSEKKKGWQDAYMGKLVQEYMEILQKDVSASGRFWTLEERIKKDRKNPGLIVEMSRRRLLSNLANLAAYGVIHKSDLEEFSDKMKKDIEEIMDYNGIDYK